MPLGLSNLRETHIFTPSKGTSTVARDVSDLDNVIHLQSQQQQQKYQINDDDGEFSDFQSSSSEIKINKNVINKEYRDVEYNVPSFAEKPITNEKNNILQPKKLQADPIQINWPDPGEISSSMNFDNFSSSVSMQSESKRNSDEFEFSEFQGTNTIKYETGDEEDISEEILSSSAVNSPERVIEYSKPSFGVSPTENIEKAHGDLEDEFTDFQYVPPTPAQPIATHNPTSMTAFQNPINSITIPMVPVNVSQENRNSFNTSVQQQVQQPMSTLTSVPLQPVSTMSSSSLKPNPRYDNFYESDGTSKERSIWADPSGIDSDEIARIEAAFSYNKPQTNTEPPVAPTPKIPNITSNSMSATKSSIKSSPFPQSSLGSKDDDEWTDFVSSIPAHQSNPTQQNPSGFSSRAPTIPTVSSHVAANTSQDDEWTDFISSGPVVPTIHNQHHYQSSISSSQSKPNFSSWNSSQIPPPQFNSWHSVGQTSTYQSLTHTNGLILNPLSNAHQLPYNSNSIASFNHLQQRSSPVHKRQNNFVSQQKTPNIAILPDLSFKAPRNIINVPRANFSTKK